MVLVDSILSVCYLQLTFVQNENDNNWVSQQSIMNLQTFGTNWDAEIICERQGMKCEARSPDL